MAIGRNVLATAFALAALALPTVAFGEQSLLDRCWTTQDLAGSDKEVRSLRSCTRFDLGALKQETLETLTPCRKSCAA
jgi:hypothetical protein